MTAVASSPYAAARGMTVDEWFALPDDGNRYELLEGMLVLMPPPDYDHNDAGGLLFRALANVADVTGGSAFYPPTGVVLSPQISFEPDTGYVSPERVHLIRRRGIEGAPDIAVEVLSPGTKGYDRRVKLPLYFEAGGREVWLVDVDSRTVTVYTSPTDARTCAFGEPIPSRIVDVGSARLERLIKLPD